MDEHRPQRMAAAHGEKEHRDAHHHPQRPQPGIHHQPLHGDVMEGSRFSPPRQQPIKRPED